MNASELHSRAMDVTLNAYSPYSHFRVGAALLTTDGRIFLGVNIENRSFGLTICAERSAVCQAITAGCHSFAAIAIATPDATYPVGPCGACRQVLSEFMPATALIHFGSDPCTIISCSIEKILPFDSLQELKDPKICSD